MSITFTLPIAPKGKQRPRFGQGHAFTPDATRSFENDFALLARPHMPRAPLEGPVHVRLVFGMRTAKHVPSTPHAQKPDLDNLVKAVLDALNGIAFKDDAQIAELRASKVWAEQPCIHVEIDEVRS